MHSYKGYDKGVFRTLLNLAINVSCIILGIILSSVISSISSKIIEKLITAYAPQLTALANSFGMGKTFNTVLTSYEPLLIMAGQFVMGALLAVPCFLIFKIIAGILLKTKFKSLLAKDKNNLDYSSAKDSYFKRKSKTYGAIVGGISGFIVAIFIISPIIGGVKVGERGFNYVKETMLKKPQVQVVAQELDEGEPSNSIKIASSDNGKASSSLETLLSTFEVPYANEFATEFAYVCGGKLFFNSMTTAKVLGRSTNIERELSTVEDFNIKELVNIGENFTNLDNEECLNKINKYSKMMKSSVSFSVVASKFFSQSSKTFMANVNNENRGLKYMAKNLATPTCKEVLKICSQSDGETVRDNMLTLVRLSQVLKDVDWEAINNDYSLLFSGDGVIEEISKVLKKSKYMKHLVKKVENIPVTILTKQMTSKLQGFNYELFLSEFKDVVENASALSEYKMRSEIYVGLKDGLLKNGIEIDSVLLDRITTNFIDSIKDDIDGLEEQDINEFFLDNGYVAK